MPHRHWSDLTTTDFAAWDREKTIVVMPVGSVEQHGPHLPVCVDYAIVDGVVTETLAQLPDDVPVLVLPTMPVGKADEHKGFPGTLSLSVQTLIALWTDIGDSVFRAGFKKLMILNGHGGQSQVTEIVARDLRIRHGGLVVPVNWWSVRPPPHEFPADEYTYGIHGGAEETSVMMHLHPDLVKGERLESFITTAYERREKFPLLYGAGSRPAWKAEDLNKAGACGDATKATPETGKQILKTAAASLAALLQEMHGCSLPENGQ